jgi:hypothetical protein
VAASDQPSRRLPLLPLLPAACCRMPRPCSRLLLLPLPSRRSSSVPHPPRRCLLLLLLLLLAWQSGRTGCRLLLLLRV